MLRIPTEGPKDLQTFINMVNYLGKFIPHLGDQSDKQINSASHTMKIPKLHGYGQVPSGRSLQQIKPALVSDDRLALYDPNQPTIHN